MRPQTGLKLGLFAVFAVLFVAICIKPALAVTLSNICDGSAPGSTFNLTSDTAAYKVVASQIVDPINTISNGIFNSAHDLTGMLFRLLGTLEVVWFVVTTAVQKRAFEELFHSVTFKVFSLMFLLALVMSLTQDGGSLVKKVVFNDFGNLGSQVAGGAFGSPNSFGGSSGFGAGTVIPQSNSGNVDPSAPIANIMGTGDCIVYALAQYPEDNYSHFQTQQNASHNPLQRVADQMGELITELGAILPQFMDAIIAVGIGIVFLYLAVQMFIAIVDGLLLLAVGAIMLGFAGSRWTSDMANHFFKFVLHVGLKVMAINLVAGLCAGLMYVKVNDALAYVSSQGDQFTVPYIGMHDIAGVAMYGVLAVFLALQANKFASALAGHPAINLGGEMVGAAVGAAAGAAMLGGAALTGGAALAGKGASTLAARNAGSIAAAPVPTGPQTGTITPAAPTPAAPTAPSGGGPGATVKGAQTSTAAPTPKAPSDPPKSPSGDGSGGATADAPSAAPAPALASSSGGSGSPNAPSGGSEGGAVAEDDLHASTPAEDVAAVEQAEAPSAPAAAMAAVASATQAAVAKVAGSKAATPAPAPKRGGGAASVKTGGGSGARSSSAMGGTPSASGGKAPSGGSGGDTPSASGGKAPAAAMGGSGSGTPSTPASTSGGSSHAAPAPIAAAGGGGSDVPSTGGSTSTPAAPSAASAPVESSVADVPEYAGGGGSGGDSGERIAQALEAFSQSQGARDEQMLEAISGVKKAIEQQEKAIEQQGKQPRKNPFLVAKNVRETIRSHQQRHHESATPPAPSIRHND